MKKIKSNKVDFTINNLPKNRREQCKDLLKNRFLTILVTGLFLLLFFIPYFLTILYKDSALIVIQNGPEAEIVTRTFSLNIIYNILSLISLIILFVGISGILKIYKQLIYNEPLFLKEDFIDGIKENFKSLVLIVILIWVFNFMEYLISFSFQESMFGYIPLGVNYALIFPIFTVMIYLSSVYTNSFFVNLKSSIIIYFKHFPSIILGFVFLFGFFFLRYIPNTFIKYISIIIGITIVFPLAIFINYENYINIFDIDINRVQFPNFYKKGLKYDKSNK